MPSSKSSQGVWCAPKRTHDRAALTLSSSTNAYFTRSTSVPERLLSVARFTSGVNRKRTFFESCPLTFRYARVTSNALRLSRFFSSASYCTYDSTPMRTMG